MLSPRTTTTGGILTDEAVRKLWTLTAAVADSSVAATTTVAVPTRNSSPTGARPDSKEPIEGGLELIDWWRARGRDPREKLLVFSDAMDIDTIETSFHKFNGQVRVSYGWGTNLTNDFADCDPRGGDTLRAISLVCKVMAAAGRPAVKLSDNPLKATGPDAEIARYSKIFGGAGMKAKPVLV